ncbi:MAG: TIM barrel protein [Chthoniobacteraceae bacterium]
MKLGISSYTFGWAVGVRGSEPVCPLDEMGLLDKAHELKVGLLQIGDNIPLVAMDAGRIDRLADRAASERIKLEIGGRGLKPDNVAAHIALAFRLEADLLRFVIDDADYHPEPDDVIPILRAAVPRLESNNVTLGIENHDRFSARTLQRIIEEVGSARIGICLDTANSLGAGEGVTEVAATLAPWTVNLHVKDFAIERLPYLMGFTITGRPAGAGVLDLRSLLALLQRYDRCRTAVLELWTPPEGSIAATIAKEQAWAVQSIDYLRPFFTNQHAPISHAA